MMSVTFRAAGCFFYDFINRNRTEIVSLGVQTGGEGQAPTGIVADYRFMFRLTHSVAARLAAVLLRQTPATGLLALSQQEFDMLVADVERAQEVRKKLLGGTPGKAG